VLHTAVTSAPNALAICTANVPTPPDVNLPDGGLFKPDLVLIDEQGSLLFVEVERDTDKNIEQRQAKWRNFYQASGGEDVCGV